MFGDNFFKRVEHQTKVDKDTIMNLAQTLRNSYMKDEKTLREVVKEI